MPPPATVVDRLGDVLGWSGLQHVAGRSGAQRQGQQVGLGVGGEDDHLGPGPGLEDLLGRLDAVAPGQLDVDDHDVGLELLDDVDHLAAVSGLADDLDDVDVGHPRLDRVAHDLVVVAEDDPLGRRDTGVS